MKPAVSIIMGSKSDQNMVCYASEILADFGVDTEIEFISAHRQPNKLRDYILSAEDRGVCCFIAGAGLSAALPGVVASHTVKPVFGVPLSVEPLKGFDSLMSIVQMPAGVPVGTFAIGKHGMKNAAYMAIAFLSLIDQELAKKWSRFKRNLDV